MSTHSGIEREKNNDFFFLFSKIECFSEGYNTSIAHIPLTCFNDPWGRS